MGPDGQIAHNQSDLRAGMFAPDWAAMAAQTRSRRRDEFEEASLYSSGGGARLQELVDPSYRSSDLPGADLPPIGVQGAALVMNDTAARQLGDPFLSQGSQPAGKRMLRWLRLLFHNLLQLLLRRGRTADPAVLEVDVASPTDADLMADDLLPTIGSELLLAAATFAANGRALSTPIPTSPVAVPRRRR